MLSRFAGISAKTPDLRLKVNHIRLLEKIGELDQIEPAFTVLFADQSIVQRDAHVLITGALPLQHEPVYPDEILRPDQQLVSSE